MGVDFFRCVSITSWCICHLALQDNFISRTAGPWEHTSKISCTLPSEKATPLCTAKSGQGATSMPWPRLGFVYHICHLKGNISLPVCVWFYFSLSKWCTYAQFCTWVFPPDTSFTPFHLLICESGKKSLTQVKNLPKHPLNAHSFSPC